MPMKISEFAQSAVICGEGEPISNMMLITNGSAEASFGGRQFILNKGDIIGICDAGSGVHSFAYTALTDVSVLLYPFEDYGSLEALLRGNADIANLFIESVCRLMSELLHFRISLKNESDSAYDTVKSVYPKYESLCRLYAITAKKLPGITDIGTFTEFSRVEDWIHNYYTEIKALPSAARTGFFSGHPGITAGFMRRCTEDIIGVMLACRGYQEYLRDISSFLLNGGEHDLFALVSGLHFESLRIKDADAAVEALMMEITDSLAGLSCVDHTDYQKRLNTYIDNLQDMRESAETVETPVQTGSAVKINLSDTMDAILTYSECPEDTCHKMAKLVREFTALPDRNGADDLSRRIRKELTMLFTTVYQLTLLKSIEDPAPPTCVKMFLNFGYIDAELAGAENADYLYSIADSLKGDKSLGVYTVQEWLTAIYNGDKEPNRNEFDMDYNEVLNDLKNRGEITAGERTRRQTDKMGKLKFELENVFPIVNKLTFGRLSTYCPLFSEHNVMRKPEATLVTPALLRNALDEIRAVDFSAYCRDILYSNPKLGVTNEYIRVEALPDVILMPNIGVRGIMWQEIEGRKRETPARMFIPMFLETDLKALIIRLTGEFRWEMCKRIQGIRWNDVTNPSLTSEYSDYLQFYKNNRELSIEAKESIKSELTRAKNNYKSVFTANYAEWLLYESSGAPRLNKNVLRMMMLYCPFSAPIREKLAQHPRYTDLLNKHTRKMQQRMQHLSLVTGKLEKNGKKVPDEYFEEMEYTKR
jgi:CRP-like cAMP-binding protein